MGAKRLGGKRPGGNILGAKRLREEMVWWRNDQDSCLAWPHSGAGDRVGPFWQIQQAPDEVQGWHTQCEHPERKSIMSMLGSGIAISQKNRFVVCKRSVTMEATTE